MLTINQITQEYNISYNHLFPKFCKRALHRPRKAFVKKAFDRKAGRTEFKRTKNVGNLDCDQAMY